MSRILSLSLAVALAAGGAAMAQAPAHPFKGAALASNAKLSLAEARTIALNARPGRITDQELEKERGGSGLRYSFDLTSGGKAYEVGVDADTGAVLENKAEGAHPD